MTLIARSFGTLAAAAVVATLGTAPAAATGHEPGTTSLAEVLASDGDTFDHRWRDFDVLTNAVGAVLAAKPDSAVGVLADGTTPVTAFLPTDRAFQTLVRDLTGTAPATEEATFAAVASLGIDTVEAVLLYHVVPGATIDSRTALRSDHVALTMASGGTVTVDVLDRRNKVVRLIDADRDDANAYLRADALDINKGNEQIAHGISRVMRPLDL